MTEIKQTIEFEETVRELDAELEATGLWSGAFANSNMRTAILDAFSIFLTSNQFASEASLRESFIQIARRNSSIYAGSIFLGVRVVRRSPAGTTCAITNNGQEDFVISKWDQFPIGEKTFFSRKTYIIEPDETVNVDLFEGVVYTKEIEATGNTYDRILLEQEGFVVSDSDIELFTRNNDTDELTLWTKTDKSLLMAAKDEPVYFDITTGKGDVAIFFGDGNFGRVPTQGHTIIVKYAVTSGVFGNEGLNGQKVVFPDKTISGITTTNVSGGSGIKDPEYYSQYAPIAHRSQGSFSEFGSWKSQIMLYPGVADCVIQGQRDIAPNDKNWMGVVRVAILPQYGSWGGKTGENPTSAKWTAFLEWLRSKTYLTIQPYNPSAIMTEVVVDVYLNTGYRKDEWKKKCTTFVQQLFIRDKNTLGKTFSRSDIDDAIKLDDDGKRRPEIDYIVIKSPTEDVTPSSELEFVSARSIRVNVYESNRKEFL